MMCAPTSACCQSAMTVPDGVELEEVKRFDAQPSEGGVNRALRAIAGPLGRLAAEEDLIADLPHPGGEAQFGIAVGGRNIEVIDAVIEGVLNGDIGHVL